MNETWWVDPSQLDDDQKAILTATADSSLLILGPPGSGKTNILMLRANYVRPIGARQMVLTFTRALAEHLRSGPNVGRADQIQRGEISTFMAWARATIRNHGGTLPDDSDSFDEERRSVVDALEETVEHQRLGKLYDVIFVDEVQDFWESELQLIHRLASRVNFAGDIRQRIWKGEGLKAATAIADETMELSRHYRIGEKICEYADQILPPKADQAPLLEGCNYPERLRPSSVEAIPCADENEMIQKCIAKVKEQLRYITEEPIGVIGPLNDSLDRFMAAASADPLLSSITVRQKSNDYHAYNDSSRVRVMTVYAAKGSEFRAVHLFEGEEFKSHNRELAFTAVTRAKTEVSVYHVGPLLGHMVPASGELTTDLSTLF
ncbi:AAA family ATPase [Mesorhizobium sp. WSM4906]|uniref:AAA family ATPase n=1 Tax=Mesorhizobium sp. WSM4906 TaxID=3038546 RepID=UPI002416FA69|nr:AAA family ATPase [Mesorhizobium sp. WSM4906]WFP74740.1 AAA family ATPase [Mesorhizobium sp. WSM4906]